MIGRLNSVANQQSKGRDDMGTEVLERAYDIVSSNAEASLDAAHIIACQVVRAFHVLRAYFRQAAAHLERVDPYLANNPGLVERLVKWEENWEIGNHYLKNE